MTELPKSRIEFSHIRGDGPAETWRVEVYSDDGPTFPVGAAYVVTAGQAAELNFIFIVGQWRRERLCEGSLLGDQSKMAAGGCWGSDQRGRRTREASRPACGTTIRQA